MSDADQTPEQKRRADDRSMIQQHVNALAEHWESVHIFCSRHDGAKEQSRCINLHSGSWFTRYGQIREWVEYEEERIRIQARESLKSDGPTSSPVE